MFRLQPGTDGLFLGLCLKSYGPASFTGAWLEAGPGPSGFWSGMLSQLVAPGQAPQRVTWRLRTFPGRGGILPADTRAELEMWREGKLAFARGEILRAVGSQSSISPEWAYLCPKNRPDQGELVDLKAHSKPLLLDWGGR